jgi:hypothetical protein
MIIKNNRLTIRENEILGLFKQSYNHLCAKCGKDYTYDPFKLHVVLEDLFINTLPCPLNIGPHAWVYQKFLEGEVPAEHIRVMCKSCLRKKYYVSRRKD